MANEALIYKKITKLEEMLKALEVRLEALESTNSGSQTRLDAILSQAE